MSSFILREQFDTWQILARARNQGRFFSKVSWPIDEEFVCNFHAPVCQHYYVCSYLTLCFSIDCSGKTAASAFNCKRFCGKYSKKPRS